MLFRSGAGNVVLSTLKRSEDGNSIVARLWEIEGRDTLVQLKLFQPIRKSQHTNLIEDDGQMLDITGGNVTFPVGHHAIETIKLHP